MNTSESVKNIYAALVSAQKEITFASKDATNPHLKSKYADLPSVIDAVKVPLNNHGISYLQLPGLVENMHLHLTTRLVHESGEWIEQTMSLPMVKQDAQAYGSALTYARRYSLAAITGLYADDDDGYAASNHAKSKPKEKKGLNEGRFQGAVKAIKEGTYTAEILIKDWALTDTQMKVLDSLKNSESKNETI